MKSRESSRGQHRDTRTAQRDVANSKQDLTLLLPVDSSEKQSRAHSADTYCAASFRVGRVLNDHKHTCMYPASYGATRESQDDRDPTNQVKNR